MIKTAESEEAREDRMVACIPPIRNGERNRYTLDRFNLRRRRSETRKMNPSNTTGYAYSCSGANPMRRNH